MGPISLNLNAKAPPFSLEGVQNGKVRRYKNTDYANRWCVLFFYPADFTFICPTEIKGLQHRIKKFEEINADVVGISVDDIKSHISWAQELGGVSFPLLSDPTREMCRAYGVLNEADNKAFRGTFIISPEGKIAYIMMSPMNVGRSVDEMLRVLQALQTGRLCPSNWKAGEKTLEPDLKY